MTREAPLLNYQSFTPTVVTERQLHLRVSADEHKRLRVEAAEKDVTLQDHVRSIIQKHLEES